MASLRCSYLLLRPSFFRNSNRTLCRSVTQEVTGGRRRLTWLTLHRYSTQNIAPEKPSSVGLADELLAAKIQAEPQERRTEEGGEEGQSSEKEQQEKEKTWRTLKYSFIAFGVMVTGMSGVLIWSWGSPNMDMEGNPIPDEFVSMPVIQQYLYRTWRGMHDMNKMIQEPSREKLLPDPLKEPYIQPPYTLVLELRDVLVHPEWTYETGWRFKKRPGVEFLLHHCAPPLFEIVIYTTEQGFTAFPLIDHLDPNGYVWYRLFKDTTRYVEGKHVKDLTCLNRDLSKVICVDWDSDAVSCPRNHLKLERWDGNMTDQSLLELGFMLRTIAESEVSDVREVIDYYRTFDSPLAAFRENHRKAQEQEMVLSQKAEEERQSKTFTSSWTSSFLRRR
ncbi:mitochondrial import inner membrane translocase subunit TIM50-C-like [Homarus americanus]|uniref:Mitochondrial import inner membrane translocase subunit TIM50 n=1 Tax=Homarus americanus TaxID=6706 RepID=A0A8J5JYV9_HOMAM|nr:mitochondrial import inner membrane translocase subunit TIM50-C-like [Homarus americanus]KAG7163915.1 Mitochondrial import inner membrane translocase subunit TIM50-C-like [Homarus americanus]